MTRGILNVGTGAWAFEAHADALSDALWTETGETPFDFNYLLGWDGAQPPLGRSFIPFEGIQIAADKRLQAEIFQLDGVPAPKTYLCENLEDVGRLLLKEGPRKWALKYPQSCGGAGHVMLKSSDQIPADWPKPFVVQEFIELKSPEVYRLYCVAGELFGWNVRRFPEGSKTSPWVAHARGARYVHLGESPDEAKAVAACALKASKLFDSFGVVDLLPSERGWLALEVGTDGLFNHVDREVDNPDLTEELDRRLAEAFWRVTEIKPWGAGGWQRRKQKAVAL